MNEHQQQDATEATADASEEEAREHDHPAAAAAEPDAQHMRLLEAILFSAPEPLSEAQLAERLPDDAALAVLLSALEAHYRNHGINLVCAGGRWFFRTADDLSEQLKVYMKVPRRLSRAAMETLAVIAYHQPVTRAEIEEIRGVGLSRGTLDMLLEGGWIAPKGRRRTAGRPTTWGTTVGFLTDFGLADIRDLPGLDELKASGLLDKRPAMQITDIQEGAFRDDEDEEGDGDQEGHAEGGDDDDLDFSSAAEHADGEEDKDQPES